MIKLPNGVCLYGCMECFKKQKSGIVDYVNKSKINKAEPLRIKSGLQFSNVFEVQG